MDWIFSNNWTELLTLNATVQHRSVAAASIWQLAESQIKALAADCFKLKENVKKNSKQGVEQICVKC